MLKLPAVAAGSLSPCLHFVDPRSLMPWGQMSLMGRENVGGSRSHTLALEGEGSAFQFWWPLPPLKFLGGHMGCRFKFYHNVYTRYLLEQV